MARASAVRRGELDRFFLRLVDRLRKTLDLLIDGFQFPGSRVRLFQLRGHLVEARVRLGRLFLDLLKRFSGRRQLGAVKLNLRQHRAERGPLLT